MHAAAAALQVEVSDQFWPTMATVVPVLALALIVEARSAIDHWDERIPWWVRSTQGFSWALVLVQFAIVEIVAFNDLAGNERSDAWVGIAKGSILVSLSTLILTPTLSILAKANAGVVVRVLVRARTAPVEWGYHRISNRSKKLERRIVEVRKNLAETLALAEADERRVLSGENPDSTESQDELARIASVKADILGKIESFEQDFQELINARTEARQGWEGYIQNREEIIKEFEKELSGINTPSETSGKEISRMDGAQAADDGG
jgi:hypothetical protein